jgi:hypothetical protein
MKEKETGIKQGGSWADIRERQTEESSRQWREVGRGERWSEEKLADKGAERQLGKQKDTSRREKEMV